MNALAQSNIFSTTKNPLLTKQKVKPNGPQTAFKTCYEGKCQCKEKVTNCYLSDRSGAVIFEIASSAEQDTITLTCEGSPRDTDSLLNQISHKFTFHSASFKLRNCAQLPKMLRRPNVTYMGDVEFNTQMLVPEEFFWHAKGLLTLRFNITTDDLENSFPPLLFHKLKELINLELIIVSDATLVTVPELMLHELHGLEVLSLYVYHLETGYYEPLDARRTTVRNLSSAHFRDLWALRSLLLDANNLQTLNDTMLMPLRELNQLGLSLNGLEQLPANLLATQSKLVVIDLSMNSLTSLPLGIFKNTPLLWKLQLAENRFKTPTNIIESVRPLRYLHQLDLSNNQLVQLWGTGSLSNRSLLTRTNISAPLEVPQFATYVSWERGAFNERQINLTSINLRKNRIAQFNLDWIAVGGLTCPYELNLLNNNIKNIYAAIQPLGSTHRCKRRLMLQFNPLNCDCSLAWVYSSNLLTRYEQWTCAAPPRLQGKLLNQLQRSDLCAWPPAFCPERCRCSYERMSSLIVNCTGAQLQSISQLPRPEQFALARTTLYLERNNFYELPANTTFGYANVTHIYAAHNRLAFILPSHIPSKLSVLDVRHNRLERLSDGFLRNYLNESDTLKELYLSDNPWFCDCESELLLRIVSLQRYTHT
ncbi:PREDICTED: protein toll-like [Rhagoletis zephyria]|uniref:protein toll-like n=1 Tax=Rhagoletis zephyria TaxID=28612 RepID=UPI00081153BD|nr:PREDICTED: protein toll-like [Rhagoletis zephyria]